jgi:glycosyltransferase involved in cell wall biosynthesis
MDSTKIRLHIPGVPYTITNDEYSHDAFTDRVKLFSPMMRSRGFEVYHYGIETSKSGATKQIDLMTKDEWTELRIKTWQFVEPTLTYEEAAKKNSDPTQLVNTLSNWSSPLTKEFNRRFRKHLIENHRGNQTDIICIPLSRTYTDAIDNLGFLAVEIGIGYTGSYSEFRIFDSHTWLANTLGQEDKQPNNYWFAIPHPCDTNEFKLSLNPTPLKVGYLGRITSLKGCGIIREIAKRFPHVQFILCGQGNPAPFLLDVPNVIYKLPIHGKERSDYLGDCIAFLHPVKYLEPFGCGPVEAQLCGTPVITSDWGGMVETVEQFKTGLRCHTLADFCYGIQMAIDGKFDRSYIRERAAKMYDIYNVAYQYEYAFKSILEIYTPGKNGWYSPDSHIGPFVENCA